MSILQWYKVSEFDDKGDETPDPTDLPVGYLFLENGKGWVLQDSPSGKYWYQVMVRPDDWTEEKEDARDREISRKSAELILSYDWEE